jgi:hypothetical protein
MMAYKKWLIQQQRQEPAADPVATANHISVPANTPPTSPAWSNQDAADPSTLPDPLSMGDLFGSSLHFDDHETMASWSDLSWLDDYTPPLD